MGVKEYVFPNIFDGEGNYNTFIKVKDLDKKLSEFNKRNKNTAQISLLVNPHF